MASFLASLAPATLRGYRYDLRHFLVWHSTVEGKPFAVGSLAEYEMIAYRQHMIAAGRRSTAAWTRCAGSAGGHGEPACSALTPPATSGRCA